MGKVILYVIHKLSQHGSAVVLEMPRLLVRRISQDKISAKALSHKISGGLTDGSRCP